MIFRMVIQVTRTSRRAPDIVNLDKATMVAEGSKRDQVKEGTLL